MNVSTKKDALLSEDGTYRYMLSRSWDETKPTLTFVMLNPSTANADIDDPTIRRCVGFANRDGYGRVVVVNLYAYRATNPKQLALAPDAVGPQNDFVLRQTLGSRALLKSPVVAAWGVNAKPERVQAVNQMLPDGMSFLCLGKTKDGHPKHPLYVPGDQDLMRWSA